MHQVGKGRRGPGASECIVLATKAGVEEFWKLVRADLDNEEEVQLQSQCIPAGSRLLSNLPEIGVCSG